MFNRKKLKEVLPQGVISSLRSVDEKVKIHSLLAALQEQGLTPLNDQLSRIIPDISNQYSTFSLDSNYLRTKVRAQHTFQISMV
jgi:hypothetical protein